MNTIFKIHTKETHNLLRMALVLHKSPLHDH